MKNMNGENKTPTMDHHENRSSKVPPFVKKLALLAQSCPPEIGVWSEDGSHFLVKSSQFADLVREHFESTLQTFMRQLHFYSFSRNETSNGCWTFAHPSFRRNQPELLQNIQRRAKSKHDNITSSNQDSSNAKSPANVQEDAEGAVTLKSMEKLIQREMQRIEMRMAEMLQQHLNKVETLLNGGRSTTNPKKRHLEEEHWERITVAENLLLLAPPEPAKTVVQPSSNSMTNEMRTKERCSETEEVQLPHKRLRGLSNTDAYDVDATTTATATLATWDSSSARSATPSNLSELDIDFDELLSQIASTYDLEDGQQPLAATNGEGLCEARKNGLLIPNGFVLKPGVTIPLLKLAFDVFAQKCSSKGTNKCACSRYVKHLSSKLPHPSTLPPADECELGREMLPELRKVIDANVNVSDAVLVHTIRHVYELFHHAKKTHRTQSVTSNSTSVVQGGSSTACCSVYN